jgi:hypothetical protein
LRVGERERERERKREMDGAGGVFEKAKKQGG